MLRQLSRSVLTVVLLGAPFLVVSLASARFVGPASVTAASALSQLTRGLGQPKPTLALPATGPTVGDAAAVARAPAARPKHRKPSGPAAISEPPVNLFVSTGAVLRLANGAARPHGSFVSTAEGPTGLRLTGVAALGIGLEEGDVLIEAVGQPAHDSSAVIAAVIASRAKKAPYLSGKLWRSGHLFSLTVEQPY